MTTHRRPRQTPAIAIASWLITAVLLFVTLPRMADVPASIEMPTPSPAPTPSYERP